MPATNSNGYNEDLTLGLWPNLVYSGDGAKSQPNPQENLYSSLTWSAGDSVITIDLKAWKWSDGAPITSRDFTFVYNLLKWNYNDWFDYVQGLFPVDVASVATPNPHTVVIHLTRSYNPQYYTDDVLATIPLLPQQAWDKTSMTGKVGNYDETKAGAKAVWNFLQSEGSQMGTFDTNPLWQVVDGPWKLSDFQSSGYYSWVPNKNYSGPDKPVLSKVIWTPFTTDTAEMDTLRSGTSLDVALVPLNDIRQVPALKAEGYDVADVPTAGVAEILPNFWNNSTGPMLRNLYIRQAMEYLINRKQIVSKVFAGYADPGNGPVPVTYGQQWDSPLEKAGGPYAYDPAKAIALLKAHGWKVVPNGTDTCQRAGTGPTDCGAGVTAGEPLKFQLLFGSGTAVVRRAERGVPVVGGARRREDHAQVRAVQHAGVDNRDLQRPVPPGGHLQRLAAGAVRLQRHTSWTRRAPACSTPTPTATTAATRRPKWTSSSRRQSTAPAVRRSLPTRITRPSSCRCCTCRMRQASSSTRTTWRASRRSTRSPVC